MKYVVYLLVALFLLSLLTGVTQVQPGERAVIWRFGRVRDEKPGPGLYIGLPWGIDRVERVPIELVRRVTVGYDQRQADEDALATPAGQLLTGDHNLVNVQVVLDYIVVEDEVEQFVAQQDRVELLVKRAAETVLAEWMAGRGVEEVLLHGKRTLPQHLTRRTQECIAPYRLGIRIQSADVTHLYPPAEVKSAFDDVTRAQAEVQTELFKAEQDATARWREAEAVKFRLESQAAAYRREQELQAAAEVENFAKRLAAYRESQRRDPLPVQLAVRLAGLSAAPHGGPLLGAAAAVPGSSGGQYLNALWWDEMSRLYARLRENGRIDVLDNYLSGEGLTITQVPNLPKRK
jgi:membrane protease subunit HflK